MGEEGADGGGRYPAVLVLSQGVGSVVKLPACDICVSTISKSDSVMCCHFGACVMVLCQLRSCS